MIDVKLDQFGGGEVATIRRLTVGERNKLSDRFKLGSKDPDAGKDGDGITYGIAIVALSVVPAMSEQDVVELPAAIIDELAGKILDFNGWTERSRKEHADQFRPTT